MAEKPALWSGGWSRGSLIEVLNLDNMLLIVTMDLQVALKDLLTADLLCFGCFVHLDVDLNFVCVDADVFCDAILDLLEVLS